MALLVNWAVWANIVLVPSGFLLGFFRREPAAMAWFRENRRALGLLSTCLTAFLCAWTA
jgi:hypothetical protein